MMSRRILDDYDSIDLTEALPREEKERRLKIWEWGKWRRGGMPDGSARSGPTPNITDEQGINVDRQVAKLPGNVKIVIIMHYGHCYGINELAEKMSVSNRVIMELRNEGINIIWGAMKELDQVH
jgi:DNA-directed RNA polymerase specialized sigma24 family protein